MVEYRLVILMYDELTQVDIDKMQKELDHRILVLRPKILEEVKFTRSFGDLSENAEYHAAKFERSRNESRIRYLKNMIKTAIIIKPETKPDEICLFDTVTYTNLEDNEDETVRIVTTMRQNALDGIISNKSPLGVALLGHKTGDRVTIKIDDDYSYTVIIKQITKGTDDENLDIVKY